MENSGAVIVSWSFVGDKDAWVLVVGNKEKGKPVDVINAFKGDEAEKIHRLLTTKGVAMDILSAEPIEV